MERNKMPVAFWRRKHGQDGTETINMEQLNKKFIEFQDRKVSFLPLIRVSRWTYDKLSKIQAARGIPLEIWVESELVKAIHREWDFEENRPRRGPNHG